MNIAFISEMRYNNLMNSAEGQKPPLAEMKAEELLQEFSDFKSILNAKIKNDELDDPWNTAQKWLNEKRFEAAEYEQMVELFREFHQRITDPNTSTELQIKESDLKNAFGTKEYYFCRALILSGCNEKDEFSSATPDKQAESIMFHIDSLAEVVRTVPKLGSVEQIQNIDAKKLGAIKGQVERYRFYRGLLDSARTFFAIAKDYPIDAVKGMSTYKTKFKEYTEDGNKFAETIAPLSAVLDAVLKRCEQPDVPATTPESEATDEIPRIRNNLQRIFDIASRLRNVVHDRAEAGLPAIFDEDVIATVFGQLGLANDEDRFTELEEMEAMILQQLAQAVDVLPVRGAQVSEDTESLELIIICLRQCLGSIDECVSVQNKGRIEDVRDALETALRKINMRLDELGGYHGWGGGGGTYNNSDSTSSSRADPEPTSSAPGPDFFDGKDRAEIRRQLLEWEAAFIRDNKTQPQPEHGWDAKLGIDRTVIFEILDETDIENETIENLNNRLSFYTQLIDGYDTFQNHLKPLETVRKRLASRIIQEITLMNPHSPAVQYVTFFQNNAYVPLKALIEYIVGSLEGVDSKPGMQRVSEFNAIKKLAEEYSRESTSSPPASGADPASADALAEKNTETLIAEFLALDESGVREKWPTLDRDQKTEILVHLWRTSQEGLAADAAYETILDRLQQKGDQRTYTLLLIAIIKIASTEDFALMNDRSVYINPMMFSEAAIGIFSEQMGDDAALMSEKIRPVLDVLQHLSDYEHSQYELQKINENMGFETVTKEEWEHFIHRSYGFIGQTRTLIDAISGSSAPHQNELKILEDIQHVWTPIAGQLYEYGAKKNWLLRSDDETPEEEVDVVAKVEAMEKEFLATHDARPSEEWLQKQVSNASLTEDNLDAIVAIFASQNFSKDDPIALTARKVAFYCELISNFRIFGPILSDANLKEVRQTLASIYVDYIKSEEEFRSLKNSSLLAFAGDIVDSFETTYEELQRIASGSEESGDSEVEDDLDEDDDSFESELDLGFIYFEGVTEPDKIKAHIKEFAERYKDASIKPDDFMKIVGTGDDDFVQYLQTPEGRGLAIETLAELEDDVETMSFKELYYRIEFYKNFLVAGTDLFQAYADTLQGLRLALARKITAPEYKTIEKFKQELLKKPGRSLSFDDFDLRIHVSSTIGAYDCKDFWPDNKKKYQGHDAQRIAVHTRLLALVQEADPPEDEEEKSAPSLEEQCEAAAKRVHDLLIACEGYDKGNNNLTEVAQKICLNRKNSTAIRDIVIQYGFLVENRKRKSMSSERSRYLAELITIIAVVPGQYDYKAEFLQMSINQANRMFILWGWKDDGREDLTEEILEKYFKRFTDDQLPEQKKILQVLSAKLKLILSIIADKDHPALQRKIEAVRAAFDFVKKREAIAVVEPEAEEEADDAPKPEPAKAPDKTPPPKKESIESTMHSTVQNVRAIFGAASGPSGGLWAPTFRTNQTLGDTLDYLENQTTGTRRRMGQILRGLLGDKVAPAAPATPPATPAPTPPEAEKDKKEKKPEGEKKP